MQSLFTQNVIALIWDFHKTLTPTYMQTPLFKRFGVDERQFWNEANGLEKFYRDRGAHNVSKDTLYLKGLIQISWTSWLENGMRRGAFLFRLSFCKIVG
jgi:hypothetical protein